MQWQDRFSLIAGTSVGALLAAGLATGKSAKDLLDAMKKHGPSIFPPRRFHFARRLVGKAPFKTETLRKAAEEVLGDKKDALLSEVEHPLVVSAVDYTKGTTIVFCSGGLGVAPNQHVKLIDAILASAAAPTYFPMVKIGHHEHADGGLVANAPDLVALVKTIEKQRADLNSTYMLSIGTASWKDGQVLRDKADDPGILASLRKRQLIQTIMSAQESLAIQQAQVLLNKRHLRIDREPDENQIAQIVDLDNASPQAYDTLSYLADAEWADWQDKEHLQRDYRLRDFFSR